MKKYVLAAAVYVLVSVSAGAAQSGIAGLPSEVDFYAIVADVADGGKIAMTQDLFYTQLMSFNGITVTDKRKTRYQDAADELRPDALAFHAEIKESEAEWECTLYMDFPAEGKTVSVSNTYDSYYKILTEAKTTLQTLFSDLAAAVTDTSAAATDTSSARRDAIVPTLEGISGTWSGEENINKIVILRGGRGFVIFRNGASMNISVEIKNGQVICTQTGKSNASFFPDMPREIALVAALNAEPIAWTLSLTENGTLSGIKKTLRTRYDGGEAAGTETAEIGVTWHKQQ
ncbi:TP0183 family DNA metabolism protein [Treponema brennaborense]|uniref:DUF4468 domain-containing protein n=1 Tax=Treponema brennaborense (strain DSM 12168 / CIP 105900 / DD5/3) TaxID=906968 RepID=F4LP78_TREBD|nr:hypothetical protein [Treponema brennaborense]AEE16940.1 hypothetical protein Trebr_1517 [Treponema brennaborense DSM 12168]